MLAATDSASTLDSFATVEEGKSIVLKLPAAKAALVSVLTVCGLVFGAAGVAQAAPTSVYGVYNGSPDETAWVQRTFSLGGAITSLQPREKTTQLGWSRAGGVTVLAGMCAQRWISTNGSNGPWTRAGADWRGAGYGTDYRLAGDYWVKIVPYWC